jgi:SseB protein N-terminal domain
LTTGENEIEKLVEIAAQENSHAARRLLFQAIGSVEVFFPFTVERQDGNEVRSTPLLRLPDGAHAMMLFTSKAHPHLSEHEQFAGGTFQDALAAALKMPPLDWVILSNSASHRVTIDKQQITAILDDLKSGAPDLIGSAMVSEGERAGQTLEDFITHAVRSESKAIPSQIRSALADRELFLELAAGEGEDRQPMMKTFQIEHLRQVVRIYTSRVRPGIRYGGIRWEALIDMVSSATEINAVQIMNEADDWIVFDREALGLDASGR